MVQKRLNLQVDGYISVGTTAAVDRNFLLTAIEGRGVRIYLNFFKIFNIYIFNKKTKF